MTLRMTLWVLALLIACTPAQRSTPLPTESPRLSTSTSIPPTPNWTPSLAATIPSQRIPAPVVRVVDGDTIEVNLAGKTYTVRYIGINTPETVAPNRPVEWMGPEASTANKALVEGKTVQLEKDISETDQYNRLLRYVYVGDLFVNAELVRQGFAQVATYPPDVKYQSLFLQLQQEARAAGRGLWGAQAPTLVPAKTLTRTSSPPTTTRSQSSPVRPLPTATVRPAANCDPSYPDVCIKPSPPDLDCRDIPYRRFRVLPPDPHKFDNDRDGIGCES